MSSLAHDHTSTSTLGPRRLYTALAKAEMVTWTLLILGLIGKYVLDLGQLGVRIGGSIHGFVFLSYCLVTLLVGIDRRWRLLDIIVGLGSAVTPYSTVPFKRAAEERGLLSDEWRLASEPAHGPIEGIVAAAVKRPALAAVVALVAVIAVFGGLLWLGPPTEWFS